MELLAEAWLQIAMAIVIIGTSIVAGAILLTHKDSGDTP